MTKPARTLSTRPAQFALLAMLAMAVAFANSGCSGQNTPPPDATLGQRQSDAGDSQPGDGPDIVVDGPEDAAGAPAETGQPDAGLPDRDPEGWTARVCEDPESDQCSAACANSSYAFIKRSLRPWSMNTKAGGKIPVLLVPLTNPSSDAPPSHRLAYKDVYHLFPASIVVPLLIEAGDVDLAAKILEFYFQLFENREAHPELWSGSRFDGFPEIYKDMSGAEKLLGDIRPDPGDLSDSGAPTQPSRGMGPNAWLANASLYYYAFLKTRAAPGDAADMARARALAEALGAWLGYLQDDGLDAWLRSAGKKRADVPWLDGAIAGAIDERTKVVSRGPSTEGSAAAYAVFRKLERLENEAGDTTQAKIYGARADRLASWFRYVVDGVAAHVFLGRTTEGQLTEGVPLVSAEAVDAYAFLVLAGVPDADLQRAFMDRVEYSCAARNLTDREGRELTGLAFGPHAKNAIFWGPHAQVDVAAWFLHHPWESSLHVNMRVASQECRLTTFTPDGTLGEFATVDDWTGRPTESAWVGWKGLDAVEPTAWLAMREKLHDGFNILGPITWPPVVKQGDPLLGASPRLTLSCLDTGPPSGPYADRTTTGPFDRDKSYLVLQPAEEEHDCRGVWHLDVAQSDGGTSDDAGADHIMVLRYGTSGALFGDNYTFFMQASPGITHLELEFKDVTGKSGRYVLPIVPSDRFRKVILDLKGYLPGVNRQAVSEVLLHVEGHGRVKLDGVMN